MTNRARRIDVYMQKATQWRAEMEALREIVLATPVHETFKWRQPCYTYDDSNICILSSYKPGATLSFPRGALMKDPEGLLFAPGENTRAARFMRFSSVEEVAEREETLRSYLLEAIELVKSGRKVDFEATREIDRPDELIDRLDDDPEYREAFDGLTPGRQRSWCLHFGGAKKAETRASRVEKAREKVLSGKGWNER
ncbi:YdeI/OmpD-associated family protein [Histidinibacterium aquaticum]|uniref:YdhG-like domain-containing protein n=1 Tax=Histidinibacterium aquaticum TaxID=2613962 RepID=A0A5J5GRB8_9RHOB|nr:DUF1801 domain-containing protein [Histidinibacterium aquaticum]KAA9010064.1 hypothetical protein F3S47_02075 [Histidinibacterium aquaticum]